MVEVGAEFTLGQVRWKLAKDAEGRAKLVFVPRWEYEELQAVKQPRPSLVQMELIGDRVWVTRYWRDGDMPKCKLCPVCHGNAKKHTDLADNCMVPMKAKAFLADSKVRSATALIPEGGRS